MKAVCNLLFILLMTSISNTQFYQSNQPNSKNFTISSIISSMKEESKKNQYHLYVVIFTHQANKNKNLLNNFISLLKQKSETEDSYIHIKMYFYFNTIPKNKDKAVLIRNGKVINQSQFDEITIDSLSKLVNTFASTKAKNVFLQIQKKVIEKEVKMQKTYYKTKKPGKFNNSTKLIHQPPSSNKRSLESFVEINMKNTQNKMSQFTKGLVACVITLFLFVGCLVIVRYSVEVATDCRAELNRSQDKMRMNKANEILTVNEPIL